MPTKDFKSQLKAKLTGKVVICCAGSCNRGDDIFGPLVARQIAGKVEAEVIDAENIPENYLGKIAKLKPDVVLLVDAAHFGGQAGEIRLLDPQDLEESNFSTHSASLKLFEEYFRVECNSKVMLLAVQPQHVRFGVPPSAEVVAAVNIVAKILGEVLPADGVAPKER